MRDRLVEHVEATYDVSPTADDNRDAAQNIAVADLFERQRLDVVEWEDLDRDLGRSMVAAAEEVDADSLSDDAVRFVQRNTRHPMRVVGLRRVRVDEYPETALREALVNAIAHRDYREAGVKVTFEVFHDRVVVTSPGLPAGGQSLTRIASNRG